jgi:hypothetical protein
MKRPAPDAGLDGALRLPRPTKRVRHSTKHPQPQAQEVAAGPLDEALFRQQLQQGVLLALSAVGFDAADRDALQMFCSLADECRSPRGRRESKEETGNGADHASTDMRHFLGAVRASMTACRRTSTTPQDFVAALSATRLAPSQLAPFAAIPADVAQITQPALRPAPPPPPEEAPPDTGPLLAVLGGALAADPRRAEGSGAAAGGKGGRARGGSGRFVPRHLPPLPSRHAWQATPVFAARAEVDKMALRERATEEGVLAERALRRLTETTRKMMRGGHGPAGAGGSERRGAAAHGMLLEVAEEPLVVAGQKVGGDLERAWEAALKAAAQMDEDAEREQAAALDVGFEEDEPMDGKPAGVAPFAVLEDGASVNYDHRFWRDAASIF